MNLKARKVLVVFIVTVVASLSGCHGSYYRDSYYGYHDRYSREQIPLSGNRRARSVHDAVNRAESLRSRVLQSKPRGGIWEQRTFSNRVGSGADTHGGEFGSFELTGHGRGRIR